MKDAVRSAGKIALEIALPRGFAWRLPAREGAAALTFDDGPDPEHTPRFLDLLARHRVRATFFVVGERVERQPALARRIVAEGHVLAGHTYRHRVLVGLTREQIREELERCREAMAQAAGVDTRMFRPPRGRIDALSILRSHALGYRAVHWSRTYSDYRKDGTDALSGRMRAAPPRAGDIVLLHDNNEYTLESLDRLLPRWRESGPAWRSL